MPKSERPVAIVTGASSGIGEASARALARAGFDVVVAARRGELLERLAKELAAEGATVIPVAADLSDDEQTQEVVRRTLDACGRIDVLVNNAGFSPGAALEQIPRDGLRRIFEVNLLSTLHLCGLVAPVMREQGGGRIVNIGSMAGHVAAPLAVSYAATKAGMDAATRALRLELAAFDVRLSLVVPGFVDTPTFENARVESESLRADPDNPYQWLMVSLDEFAKKNLRTAIAPEKVGEVVVRAATAPRPRLRYYVPFSAWIQKTALAAMPERWVDAILRKVYGVD